MANRKEDPLWMRMAVAVVLRMVWALIGFFAPILALSMSRRSLTFPRYHHGGAFLLYVCLAGALVGALLGPLLYLPKSQAGAGTLDEVKRMGERTGTFRNRR